MSAAERYFSPMGNYKKVSDTAMPVDEVEAWLEQFPQKRAENKPNGGIIRSAPESLMFDGGLKGKDLAKAKAKAWREHKQALKALADQDTSDAKAIQKQRAIWAAEQARIDTIKQKEAAKKQRAADRAAAKKERAKARAEKVKGYKKSELNKFDMKMREVAERRAELAQTLESGGHIKLVVGTSKESLAAYQMQQTDLKALSDDGLSVIRIKSLKTNTSYFALDNLKRHQMQPISGLLHLDDGKDFLQAICSGEFIAVEDLTAGVRAVARSILKLVKNYGFDVHTVFDGQTIIGWILIEQQ